MFKKTLLITTLMGSAASSFAADATTVTWWHAMGGQLGETVNKMASDFNKANQQCQVNPVYKGTYEELMTSGIAAFRAKKAPNVIQIFDAGSATIINAKGAITPVADLFEQSGQKFDSEAYLPGVRNFYADSNGKMIGMPFNSSTAILYFNKEAFKKAGVQPPKTWEEFEKVAPKLKEAGYVPFSESHTPWIFAEVFHSRHNIELADKKNGFDGPATKINYNNPDMVMMFSKLKEWKDKGWFGYYGSGWGDNQVPFEKGQVAMWLGSSGSFGGLKQKADFDFGTSYLPYWDKITKGKQYRTFIGGAALFAFSGKPEAENKCTTEFFSYMSKPETQAFWHKETGYVPITTAAYEKVKAEGYYDKTPAAETGILQLNQAGDEWNKGYRLGFYPQIREVIYRETDKLMSGSTTAEKMLATVEQEGNKLLSRFAKTVK